MTEAATQLEIDQRVFDLYDEYCHGRIDRRQFLLMAGAVRGSQAKLRTDMLNSAKHLKTHKLSTGKLG
jgi:hypothetical protein